MRMRCGLGTVSDDPQLVLDLAQADGFTENLMHARLLAWGQNVLNPMRSQTDDARRLRPPSGQNTARRL
jgi:hypothetical protein